jgi:acyl carrier protein
VGNVSVTTELQDFILDEIAPGRAITVIDPDDDLLSRGIIDSLGVTQLLEFLRDRYGIVVAPADLVPGNFRNVRAIEAFIHARQGGPVC